MAVLPADESPQHSELEPVPFIDLVSQYNTISGDVLQAVERVFAGQMFVLGDEVAEFECDVAEYCDARDAVGCASGTDALHLSLLAVGVGSGDEVITTPFTFIATAGAIDRVGATPVFVDIEPTSFNLDPNLIEAAVTDRTRAIVPVHLFGQCAEMEPIWRLAGSRGLSVIEDACQAIGAEYHGRRAGVLGAVGCFSFFPTKNLGGAGDGGIITSDDPELAKRLRQLRVHGDTGGYQHVEVGMNSRLDAVQAAVLRVKLAHLEQWTEARQQNAARYGELFAHYDLLESITLPTVLPGRRHVYSQFTIRVKDGRRDEVLHSLRKQQLGAAIYYPTPLHLQACFRDLGYVDGDFPQAEAAAREVLALPVYPELRPDQQELVVRGIARALGRLSKEDPAAGPKPKYLKLNRRAA